MANRLAEETSPYLLQHAHQGVDWWPWGKEALSEARRRDVPILLSVGYSACHWCHVMSHESFDDSAIAASMNAGFVCVKVDREERPDVDALYMEAVQAMTGHGGWPMTVFLTPRGEPFYGGTYYPPTPRGGMPGFADLLAAIGVAWRDRRSEVSESATHLAEAIRRTAAPAAAGAALTSQLADAAAANAARAYDARNGGFGGAPKFPSAPTLRFVLDHALRQRDAGLLRVALGTLGAMARGGLRDHLGGGFHRYCVDDEWTVPHFEKMLYDNTQLAELYLDAWLATGLLFLREVTEETLDWLLGAMQAPEGGFHATMDADTSAGEGVNYAWRRAEIESLLPPEEAAAALAFYGVSAAGNFEDGMSVLTARREVSEVAEALGIESTMLAERLLRAREAMRAARAEREAPAVDRKIITVWNGQAVTVLARAGAVLGRADYLGAAERAARFVLGTVVDADGGLSHSWLDGRPGAAAFVEDYGAMAMGTLALYEATFDPTWLEEARLLIEEATVLFAASDGGFYRAGTRHDQLFARQKEIIDGALPSGNGQLAEAMLRASSLLGDPDMRHRAADALRVARPVLERAPLASPTLLGVLESYLAGSREVAVVGAAEASAPLVAELRGRPRSSTVLAWRDVEGAADAAAVGSAVPLLDGRAAPAEGAAAYVCAGFACAAPVHSAAALREALGPPWPDASVAVTKAWLRPDPDTGASVPRVRAGAG